MHDYITTAFHVGIEFVGAMPLGYWTAVAVVVLALLLWYRMGRGATLPPGPWGIPVLGYLPWIDPAAPHLTLSRLARRYGGIYSLQMGSVFTVVLSDQRFIKEAFVGEAYSGRAPLHVTHGIMQGYGLICAEGELWKDQRKFVTSCLKNLGMVKFGTKRQRLEERISVGVRHCVQKLRELPMPLDPLPTLEHSLGNVMNDIVFARTYAEDDAIWKWLQHLQEEGTKMMGVAGPINFLPFLRFLPRYRNMMRFLLDGKKETHALYQRIIDEYEASNDKDGQRMPAFAGNVDKMAARPECNTIMGAYLAERKRRAPDGSVGFYTMTQCHHLLADMFGAGVDTTLTTLRWFLLFMATHRSVQSRVQEELDVIVGRRLPTLADLAVLPLTEASLAETQRIRSVVPLGIPHGTLEDSTLAGFSIPRGTMVVPFQWGVHMDPNTWSNPETFDPSRFLAEDGSFCKPEAFIPFQTGKRMCVGEELARMLLFLFGASIVQQFDISPPDGSDVDLEGEVGITLVPKRHTLVFSPRFQELFQSP